MRPFEDVLNEFYWGEVAGEAIYSELIANHPQPDRRVKLAALLQLETETKAWLRPHLIARGMDVTERPEDRARGAALAARVKPLNWIQFLQALERAIDHDLVPRFETFLKESEARGEAGEAAICHYMVEHERMQSQFARSELAGEAHAIDAVMRQLRFPIA